jgi:HEAT repeat protein
MRVKILAWALVFVVSACAVVRATTLREEEVTCPVCDFTFKAFGVTSTNSFGGQDTDFCVHARGTPPRPYGVWTCPKCYYSNPASKFADVPSEGTAKRILEELKPPWPIKEDMSQKDIPGWVKFGLLATVAQWEGANEADLAGIHLQASWAARLQLQWALAPLFKNAQMQGKLAALSERVDRLMQETAEGDPDSTNPRDLEVKAAGALLDEVREGKLPPEEVPLQEFLAALLYRGRGENPQAVSVLARLKESEGSAPALRAVCRNLLESIDIERRFQRETLGMIEKAMEKGLLKGQDLAVNQYLLGELHRRLGEPEKAVPWYRKAIESEAVPTHIMAMAEAARKSVGVDYEVSEDDRLASRRRTVDRLITALNDPETAGSAAGPLGALADPLALPGILKALKHEDKDVRWYAAGVLDNIPDDSGQVVAALIDVLLNDPEQGPRWAAATSLANIASPKSKEALIAALQSDPYEHVRSDAARGLGKIGDPAAIHVLEKAVGEADMYVRPAAIEALGEIADARSVDFLLGLLDDSEEGREVRWETIQALGMIADARSVPRLLAIYPESPSACQVALSRITNTFFWPAPDPKDFMAMREQPQPKALADFSTWWEENKGRSREEWVLAGFQRAGYAVNYLAKPESIPVLIEALKNPHQSIRFNAAKALKTLTGQAFGWRPITAADNFPRTVFERNLAVKQWEQWWEESKPGQ